MYTSTSQRERVDERSIRSIRASLRVESGAARISGRRGTICGRASNACMDSQPTRRCGRRRCRTAEQAKATAPVALKRLRAHPTRRRFGGTSVRARDRNLSSGAEQNAGPESGARTARTSGRPDVWGKRFRRRRGASDWCRRPASSARPPCGLNRDDGEFVPLSLSEQETKSASSESDCSTDCSTPTARSTTRNSI